jgi:hypothetical protein
VVRPDRQQIASEDLQNLLPIDPMPAPSPGEITEQALAQQIAWRDRGQGPDVQVREVRQSKHACSAGFR